MVLAPPSADVALPMMVADACVLIRDVVYIAAMTSASTMVIVDLGSGCGQSLVREVVHRLHFDVSFMVEWNAWC